MAAKTLDELDELEDSEDEAVLDEYRRRRIAELQSLQAKAKYGRVLEISARDYVEEVNKAGEDVWVVLHLYEQGIQLCALINQFMAELCVRFPATKFIKAVSTTCIPNYPSKNVPSIFIYYEGQIKKQIVGPVELRGEKLTAEGVCSDLRVDLTCSFIIMFVSIPLPEFEYMLGLYKVIPTDITEDPRPAIKDKLFSELSHNNDW